MGRSVGRIDGRKRRTAEPIKMEGGEGRRRVGRGCFSNAVAGWSAGFLASPLSRTVLEKSKIYTKIWGFLRERKKGRMKSESDSFPPAVAGFCGADAVPSKFFLMFSQEKMRGRTGQTLNFAFFLFLSLSFLSSPIWDIARIRFDSFSPHFFFLLLLNSSPSSS